MSIKSLDALNKYVSANVGKNLLINGDKSVSQRGDFTAPTAVTTATYYLDRYQAQFAVITAQLEHKPWNSDTNSKTVVYRSTSSGSAWMQSAQIVEDYQSLIGKTVTYSAQVKSDIPVVLTLNLKSGFQVNSARHSGNGGWETLRLTTTVTSDATRLWAIVSSYDVANYNHVAGDYFEVGNEQLELGDRATDFEVIDPATQLARCQRYYEVMDGTNLYVLPRFNSTTNLSRLTNYNYAVEKRDTPSSTTIGSYTGWTAEPAIESGTSKQSFYIHGTATTAAGATTVNNIKIDSELY